MRVCLSGLTIEAAPLNGENPLPKFRSRKRHRDVRENGSLSPEQKKLLGSETGERYLPYRMQDRYTRERRESRLKTIVLENEILQAVFLPDYGGRLYSLKDKRTNRELLYTNPVLQPANLAILDAWFSGGIEWNIGQLGHTFLTCSPVHAAKLSDDDGNEFLRLYDYERCKNVFWQIDFHLPPGSEHLQVYVRIVNDNADAVPMYWWTNVAVEETDRARVFASTADVIYIDHNVGGFGAGRLPVLPTVPDTDVSYPINFPFANEYFFQTSKACPSPWEAIAYEDGRLVYERSTPLLRYRKMFCWGNHAGGRRWQEFLSRPGEGKYIEIQGGLAPTQMHGIELPARTNWDFTQLYGVAAADADSMLEGHWDDARSYVEEIVDRMLPAEEVDRVHNRLRGLADREPEQLLHTGSGWGALERIRREKAEGRTPPQGFRFDDAGLTSAQQPWLELMTAGRLPDAAPDEIPVSWMVQAEWMAMLQASLTERANESWTAYLHLGVMLYEQGDEEKAIEAWERSLQLQPSAWAYRNLAEAMKQRGDITAAISYMERAYQVSDGFPDRAFAEEYVELLVKSGQHDRAWRLYESFPESIKASERLQVIAGEAALDRNAFDFLERLFATELAVIREGELSIVKLWSRYQAKKLAIQNHAELTSELEAQAASQFPPPRHIDFRMS